MYLLCPALHDSGVDERQGPTSWLHYLHPGSSVPSPLLRPMEKREGGRRGRGCQNVCVRV